MRRLQYSFCIAFVGVVFSAGMQVSGECAEKTVKRESAPGSEKIIVIEGERVTKELTVKDLGAEYSVEKKDQKTSEVKTIPKNPEALREEIKQIMK